MYMLPVPIRTTSQFCYGLSSSVEFHCVALRSPRFTTVFYVANPHRDCRGKFFDSLKIWPGNHGNHGKSRCPIPSPRVDLRSPRYVHGRQNRGCRGRREHSVNAASSKYCTMLKGCSVVGRGRVRNKTFSKIGAKTTEEY